MPTYRNGYIPESLMVSVGGGWDQYGRYEWLLSPGTKAKHDALLVRNPRLRPSPGFSCYRPYQWQVKYRSIWGNGAAWPGTSSHGGVWEGKQTLAIDYGNWAYCYGNRDGRDAADKRAAFFADCRAVGLTPNLIRPDRGYPDEPWHVIDLDPWAPVAAGGGANQFEEDDLTPEQSNKLNAIYDAIFNGGESLQDGKRPISASLANIVRRVEFIAGAVRPISREVGGRPVDVDVRQEIADAKTNTIQILDRLTELEKRLGSS